MIKKAILLAFASFLVLSIYWGKNYAPVFSSKGKSETIAILMYHRVSPDSNSLGLRVTPERFNQQLLYLKQMGYHTITLDQLINHWEKKAKLPAKPIVITFDDGYEDNYTYAYPILRKYGFSATIFLVYKRVGEYNFWDFGKTAFPLKLLSWRQILAMQKHGINFQSHTLTHRDLVTLPPKVAENEIVNSKRLLMKKLKKPVHFIAYPYGHENSYIREAAQKAGYKAGISTIQGKNIGLTEKYRLKRTRINSYTSMQYFKKSFQ